MSRICWGGVFPAITTQLRSDQSLDLDATARHVEALIASGVSGIIFLGSLGENQSLRPEEKRSYFAAMLEAVNAARERKTSVVTQLVASGAANARDIAVAASTISIARPTSANASGRVLPISRVTERASSS